MAFHALLFISSPLPPLSVILPSVSPPRHVALVPFHPSSTIFVAAVAFHAMSPYATSITTLFIALSVATLRSLLAAAAVCYHSRHTFRCSSRPLYGHA
jgi:hypothetical protein